LLLGLFVGALLALILDYLDDTLKTTADVEKALGTVILGKIPRSTAAISASSGSAPAVGRATEQAR
jgi:capsular polysaccharide biosynthesis protein